MTSSEREVCLMVLGFLDAVAHVENNIFCEGAECMRQMLSNMLFTITIKDEGELNGTD